MSTRARAHRSVERGQDADLVASIFLQLKKGGAVSDPRPYAEDQHTSLADHVRDEVQRSLNRVRSLQTFRLPAGYFTETSEGNQWVPLPKLTAAKIREAVTILSIIAFTKEQREILRQFEAVRQWPPERVNALKYQCADEAFDLMNFFSAKPPTGTEGGPFRKIAAMIYEAVTGEPHTDVDMKRACNAVLAYRRKYDPNAFKRP